MTRKSQGDPTGIVVLGMHRSGTSLATHLLVARQKIAELEAEVAAAK